MKKFMLIFVFTLIIRTLLAQNTAENVQPKLFNKLVLDLGATPASISFGDNTQMTSYNFALGYQVIKRLDIRLNMDVMNFFDNNDQEGSNQKYYERLLGLSIGIGFIAIKGKEDSFFKNTNLGFVGKFGAGIEPASNEQKSLFFDISARAHLGKIPYFGLGINHQISDVFTGSDFTSLYFSFGIDF